MMTDSELQTFTEKSDDKKVCDWMWTERNGVKGYLVTGAKDGYKGKSIFLPAAGYGGSDFLRDDGSLGHYWSSTPFSSRSAQFLYFDQNSFYGYGYDRYYGFVVRPVR